MLVHLLLVVAVLTPSAMSKLSGGPRRMRDNTQFEDILEVGANYDYVKGSIWPKPQKQIDQNLYFTLDPENFE